ncbi:hypothetical protein ACFQLX_12450 [Streptomyces polyrhachis]|uniref:Uncharacterized protein n=2 Tax=Streptomyces polyrhachis TaxID=1282885 RepID=A0ABW2GHV5_9ACTN
MAATAEGLPHDDEVVVDGPDAPLRTALDAFEQGRTLPVRELLAATREQSDWWRRNWYVGELAERLLQRPDWPLDELQPADAALLRARLALARAWEIRTGDRARNVSDEQFRSFHTLLVDAVALIEEAVRHNPGDPVPWTIALAQAMGIGAERQTFEGYLARALEADPLNWAAHTSAVQYLGKKWYGSHEEMLAFAEEAAERAPAGSVLRGLPVAALSELVLDESLRDRSDAEEKYGPIAHSRVLAAISAAQEVSAAFEPGDHRAGAVRNHLAWALIREGGRDQEVLEAFRAIGADARTFPWGYLGAAGSTFLTCRKGARAQVAAHTPVRARAGVRPEPAPVKPPVTRELALALAPVRAVAEAVLLTGTSYRMAPLAGGTGTWVETAPALDPPGKRGGLRNALLGEGDLVRLMDAATGADTWPVLVFSRLGDGAYALTLIRGGKQLAAHAWTGPAGMPRQTEALATAEVFAQALGLPDARPFAAVLRDPGEPAQAAARALAALGLPPLPEGIGQRAELLAELPGVRVVRKRSLREAIRDTLRDDDEPPAL